MEKQIFFIIVILSFFQAGFAQRTQQLDCGPIKFDIEDLMSATNESPIKDTVFDATSRNFGGSPLAATPNIIRKSSALVVNFFNLPKSDPTLDVPFDSIKVVVTIRYVKVGMDASGILTKKQTLIIQNTNDNSASNDQLIIHDVDWAEVKIDSFYSAAPLVSANIAFSTFIMGERWLKPEPTFVMSRPTIIFTASKEYFKIQWLAKDWALHYDLEWTFVDKYDQNRMPEFRNNATRVRIDSSGYEIPNIFPEGNLYCRVRAVGKDALDRIITSQWSPNSSPMMIRESDVFESYSKTYQHVSSFSDDGLRKDMVGFFDGTSRARQMVTKLNSDGNPAIVAETYYDHEGRPSIVSLPAPYKPGATYELAGMSPSGNFTASTGAGPYFPGSTDNNFNFVNNPGMMDLSLNASIRDQIFNLDWPSIINYYSSSPSLSFKSNFNQNASGKPFSKLDFDFENEACDGPILSPKMSSSSGAGKYYSEANDFDGAIHNDFVPNAGGYPYMQTIYTPDKTGRKQMSGLAGDQLKIGNGHENSVTYVNPGQDELDRIFGNDVGYADNYIKTVTTDANGQSTVVYTNAKGQVVATALSGTNPNNLSPVAKDAIFTNTIDVVAQNNNITYDYASSFATQTVYIDQDRTTVNLNYSIDPASLNGVPCLPSPAFCYDCIRDVEIEVRDECGIVVLNKFLNLGSHTDTVSTAISSCNYSSPFTYGTRIELNKGTYTIYKRLVVNQENRDKYIAHFIQKDTACFKPVVAQPVCLTEVKCIECEFEVIISNNIKALKRKNGNNIHCIYLCPDNKTPKYDLATYNTLLRDMRPGGLYGSIDMEAPNNAFKISVFNTDNVLRSKDGVGIGMEFDYKNPFFPYLNADGSEVKIDCSTLASADYVEREVFLQDGQRFVRPQSIINLIKLQEIWQESWSESLVPYHPEYAYFEWNSDNIAAAHFYTKMNNTSTYSEAVGAGLFSEDEILNPALVNRDPYMLANPSSSAAFLNALSIIGESGSSFNIFELTKQIAVCDLPVYTSSPSALSACIRGARFIDFTDEQKQFAWETYKGIYLGKREALIDNDRTSALATSGHRLYGRLNNHCIDETAFVASCLPCSADGGDELKRYLRKASRKVSHPTCFFATGGAAVIAEGTGRRWVTADEARVYAIVDWMKCSNTCPIAFEWMNFLNAVALQKPIHKELVFNSFPSIKIPQAIIQGFENARSTSYTWVPTIISRNLVVDIIDDKNSVQAKWEFIATTEDVPWKKINFFSCLYNNGKKATHGPLDLPTDGSYNLSVFDDSSKEYKIKLRLIRGIVLNNCSSMPIGGATLTYTNNEFYLNQKKFNPDSNKKNRMKLVCCLKPTPKIQPARTCEELSKLLVNAELRFYKIERAARLKDSLIAAYNKKCMTDVNERLVVSFEQPIYHFTLFYYDQSGNLIQTLPPKAVMLLNDIASVQTIRNNKTTPPTPPKFPGHNLALGTTYTYNAFGNKLTRKSPDDGTNYWSYDEVGRPIMSQTAAQRKSEQVTYSLFDQINRPEQSGVCSSASLGTYIGSSIKYKTYEAVVNRITSKSEVIVSIYDEAKSTSVQSRFLNGKQGNLRKRVASVLYKENGIPTHSDYDHGLHFNYDIAGNMKEIITDFSALSRIMGDETLHEHEKKLTRYDYSALSGKVKEIVYQPNQKDQFYHWYHYDADNRIKSVRTGRTKYVPIEHIEQEVSYDYYLHGPVARAGLGKENIQAMDLTYTINGWLKQVNSPSRGISIDPAGDGGGNGYLPDVYGLQLSYFDNDYDAIKRSSTVTHPFADNPNLYNGNIRAAITRNDGLSSAVGGGLTSQLYKYDQLGRLSQSTFGETESTPIASTEGTPWSTVSALSWTVGNKFATHLSYDKNGNISTLTRTDGTSSFFDQLDYQYESNNNRLNHINDIPLNAHTAIKDLADQDPNNYSYDASGRLIKDNSSDSKSTLTWNHRDKLKTYTNPDGISSFYYDALGRRALKKGVAESTFTVRDFSGNNQAVYTLKAGKVYLAEVPLYATSRIGTWQPKELLVSAMDTVHHTLIRGEKVYELKNLTGDIAALVSDHRRLIDESYVPDIVMAQDYYPFGMEMPGRSFSLTDQDYRYGFQGMEQDNDLKGKGKSYTTEFRQYDPRVGRWLSVDPMMEKYAGWSNYVAFDDNPINLVDPLGAQSSPPSPSGNTHAENLFLTILESPRRLVDALDVNVQVGVACSAIAAFGANVGIGIYLGSEGEVGGYFSTGVIGGVDLSAGCEISLSVQTRSVNEQGQSVMPRASDIEGLGGSISIGVETPGAGPQVSAGVITDDRGNIIGGQIAVGAGVDIPIQILPVSATAGIDVTLTTEFLPAYEDPIRRPSQPQQHTQTSQTAPSPPSTSNESPQERYRRLDRSSPIYAPMFSRADYRRGHGRQLFGRVADAERNRRQIEAADAAGAYEGGYSE